MKGISSPISTVEEDAAFNIRSLKEENGQSLFFALILPPDLMTLIEQEVDQPLSTFLLL